MRESDRVNEPKKFHIVLYQPMIPQNTGSVARLCACTGAVLHLIHPLGFRTDSASVKRAGLDYWEHVEIHEHENWEKFLEKNPDGPFFFFSKFSGKSYFQTEIPEGAFLIFGSETSGLPESLHQTFRDRFFQIPMRTHLVRSLNLSQSAAIVLYEGLRQANFVGDGVPLTPNPEPPKTFPHLSPLPLPEGRAPRSFE